MSFVSKKSVKKVNMKIKIDLTEDYYIETYDQIMIRRKKWQVLRQIIGITAVCMGLIILISAEKIKVSGYLLLALGFFELFSGKIKKEMWLKKQRQSAIFNKPLTILAEDKQVQFMALDSVNTAKWEEFEKYYFTEKGILLWPRKRLIIYLPNKILGKKAEKFFKEKLSLKKGNL